MRNLITRIFGTETPTKEPLIDDLTSTELLDAAKLYLRKVNERQSSVTFAIAAIVNPECDCEGCSDRVLDKEVIA